MTTQHLSIRIDPKTLDRLDSTSRRERMSRSELARAFIEEGLRMEAHPGIVFKPGPTGRRPSLAAGPDVWQIIREFKQLDGPEDDIVKLLSEIATVSPYEVRTVLDYYRAYPDEIDAWIQRVDEESDRAFAEWKREQAKRSA
jgi:hypothetical protein